MIKPTFAMNIFSQASHCIVRAARWQQKLAKTSLHILHIIQWHMMYRLSEEHKIACQNC